MRYQYDMALEEQSSLRSDISSLEAENRVTAASGEQLRLLLDGISGDSETRKNAVSAAERQIELQRPHSRKRGRARDICR